MTPPEDTAPEDHMSDDQLEGVAGGTDPFWVIGLQDDLGGQVWIQPTKSVGG